MCSTTNVALFVVGLFYLVVGTAGVTCSDGTLNLMNCENWWYYVSSSMSSDEIRLEYLRNIKKCCSAMVTVEITDGKGHIHHRHPQGKVAATFSRSGLQGSTAFFASKDLIHSMGF